MIRLSYVLEEYGWAHLEITVGEQTVEAGPFGYCSDPLGDLVRAAIVMATGGEYAEASFDGEPHGWRLVLDQGWAPECRLRLLYFIDLASRPPSAMATSCLLSTQVSVEDFAQAVLVAAAGIWDENGSADYNRRWMGRRGFPLRAMLALQTALSLEEPAGFESGMDTGRERP